MKNEKERKGLTLPKAIFLGVFIAALAIGGGMLGSAITSGKATEFLEANAKEEEKIQIIVPYSEFLINLKPVAAKDRSFLRIEFTFSVGSAENETLLLEQEPMIRDSIITILRKKTAETIFTETEGELIVKDEVHEQINHLLGDTVITEVYVTDIVMQ